MSTKQILLASSGLIVIIALILLIVFLPKHAAAPTSIANTATTTMVTVPGGTVTVLSNTATSSSTSTFDLNYWLQLGITRKEAGDYAGAIQAWKYATQQEPNNYVAFYNLGDLYQNFDKNYPLAEQNYLKVIALKPDYIDAYASLYTLYRYQYKVGTSAAADILVEGLKNNPGNTSLLALQAQFNSGQ